MLISTQPRGPTVSSTMRQATTQPRLTPGCENRLEQEQDGEGGRAGSSGHSL